MDVRGVTIPITDPPINYDPPLFVEKQAAVNRLKWGKAPGICGIHAELLKAGGNAVLMSLHVVLCSAWNTGIIPTDSFVLNLKPLPIGVAFTNQIQIQATGVA